MELKHTLAFKGEKYEISVDYIRFKQILQDVPQEIGIKLIKNIIYNVESQVSPEVFKNFLEYWQNSKEPEINYEDVYEYHLLSQEFGIKIDSISKKFTENDLCISSFNHYLRQITTETNLISDLSNHEKIIAIHLDYFLENKEDQMLQIPINSLHCIFFHPERVLNDHQKAFNFILKNRVQFPNLSILLPSLRSDQLDRNELTEFLTQNENNITFSPQLQPSFFSFYNDRINQLTEVQKCLNNLIAKYYMDKNIEVIKMIFYDKCFDLNSKISYESEDKRFEITALFIAIKSKDADLIKYILEKPEVDVNAKSLIDDNIKIVNSNDEEENLELFQGEEEKLSCERVSDECEVTPLYLAVENEDIETIKLLLSRKDLDINCKSIIIDDKYTLTSLELSQSLLKMIKSFVKSPEEILSSKEKIKNLYKFIEDQQKFSALCLAIKKENIEIIKLLLSRSDIDVNDKFIRSDYYFKAKIKNINLYECVKNEIQAPLHLAIEKGNIEIIKLLLTCQKLDINIKYYKKEEIHSLSLIAAAFFKELEKKEKIIRLLLEVKIPLNKSICKAVDGSETSVLQLAIEKGNIEIVKLLLTRIDLDMSIKSLREKYTKWTLSESEQLEIKEKIPVLVDFINKQLNSDETIKEEKTAMHIAVKKENIEIIKLLLNKNFDIELTDEQGKKPVEITSNQEIISLLENHNH